MIKTIKLVAMSAICVAAAGCQVNKTQEGKMPKVEVKTSDGQLPEYNVEGPKVEVGSKNPFPPHYFVPISDENSSIHILKMPSSLIIHRREKSS